MGAATRKRSQSNDLGTCQDPAIQHQGFVPLVTPSDLPKAIASHIRLRAPEGLTPDSGNARTHTDKQIQQIAASIREFGFNNPVLVDADDRIIAGHGRVEAAKRLGLEKLPTIRIDHLNAAQRRAYVIADNRLAELAGWDEQLLAIELQYLYEIDLDFNVEVTGFETAEIDLLIEGNTAGRHDEADDIPVVDDNEPAVTQVGDLWLLVDRIRHSDPSHSLENGRSPPLRADSNV